MQMIECGTDRENELVQPLRIKLNELSQYRTMKLSLLIAIILRLFSIYWAVTFVVGVLASLGVIGLTSGNGLSGSLELVARLAVPFFYGTISLLAWIFARVISLKVLGENDTEVSFSAITAENFYTLGVLGFGLYHSIGNLAATLNWIHFLILHRAGQSMADQASGHSLYDVSSAAVPCVAGLALAILSPKIGKRIAKAGLPANRAEETL